MPRREWRAKKLGVPVDQLPDNRGRKESLQDCIERNSMPITESGCVVWMGSCNSKGYGSISIKGKLKRVHRVAYELANGPIREGMYIDHLCRVTCCLNPSHLEQVTPRENTIRGKAGTALNSTKTHCKHGHELDGDNLILRKYGGRDCKECRKARTAASIERRKLAAGGLSLSGILPD